MFDPTGIVKQLLASAVNGGGSPSFMGISEDQWKLVLGVCAAQNVHTLVFDVLPEDVPVNVMRMWLAQTETVANYNRLASSVRETQENAWKARGLNYSLLKGESIAAMYPKPERRGAGDIDWYFGDSDSWNQAVCLARKDTESGLRMDSDGDIAFTFKGVAIEYHKDWTHLASGKLRKKAGSPYIVDGRLAPEDTLLMLICHILHHLAYAGMGLKQYADLAVALKYYDGQYDKAAFSKRITGLGLGKWVALVFATLVELFNLPFAVFPLEISDNKTDVDRLIRLIFEDGCVPVPGKINAGLLRRKLLIMGKYCPLEMAGRYFHLFVGRLSRKKFDQ